jgi:hypothetical protein
MIRPPTFRYLALFPALLVLMAGLLQACANSPIAIAETPAQKGYAVERSYNIVLEQGLKLAGTNARIRDAVQTIEARTTPVVDTLSDGLAAYEVARAEYDTAVAAAAGGAPPTVLTKLTVATANLTRWIADAQRALLELAKALNP